MIRPTVARMIWYRPGPGENIPQREGRPLAAIITGVHDDETRVNLAVFGFDGSGPYARLGVYVEQEGMPAPGACGWMPYQKGQAAKAESLEQALVTRDAHDATGNAQTHQPRADQEPPQATEPVSFTPATPPPPSEPEAQKVEEQAQG